MGGSGTVNGTINGTALCARLGKQHGLNEADSQMRFRAVLFDLFGTLVPSFSPSQFAETLREMAEVLGVGSDVFQQAWAFETWRDRATGVFDTVEAIFERSALKRMSL